MQGTYYLFYSGNNFDTAQYAISYATASAVGGPYTKHGPWLASSAVFGSVSCRWGPSPRHVQSACRC